MNQAELTPLYVDLDGTLTRSDVLVESIFALLRINPLFIFLFPAWLFHGKAHFKREIAKRVDLDVSLLPFTQDLLAFLRTHRQQGRRLVLITASDQKYADAVAEHTGIFDLAIGSDGVTNLSRNRKLNRILADCGQSGFDYAGNASDDLAVWPQAKEAIVVSPFQHIIEQAKKQYRAYNHPGCCQVTADSPVVKKLATVCAAGIRTSGRRISVVSASLSRIYILWIVCIERLRG